MRQQEPLQNLPNPHDFPNDWEQRTPLELEDDRWDVFLPDGDPEPLPDSGDFWIEFNRQDDLPEAA